MKIIVDAVDVRTAMPEPHQLVIVEGGMAIWTGNVWLSMAGESTRREIDWPVKWWMPVLLATNFNPLWQELRNIAIEARRWTKRCDDAKRIPDWIHDLSDAVKESLDTND